MKCADDSEFFSFSLFFLMCIASCFNMSLHCMVNMKPNNSIMLEWRVRNWF